jgi:hypothetical protein
MCATASGCQYLLIATEGHEKDASRYHCCPINSLSRSEKGFIVVMLQAFSMSGVYQELAGICSGTPE